MSRLIVLIVGVAVIALAGSAHCADIRYELRPDGRERLNTIVIDGALVEGDFEKFVAAVLESGAEPGNVFISSPGGSVSEAIKIGVLIRALGFHTKVPQYMGPELPPHCFNLGVTECGCASACLLVFVAGVERAGSQIEVHRTFLDHELLRTMSIKDATEYSNAVSTQVREYLQYMSSPASLNEIMQSIPSNESELLDQEWVHEHFFGPAENVEEWVIARCGNWESVVDRQYHSTSREEAEELKAVEAMIFSCKDQAFRQERWRVFANSIVEALEQTDDDLLIPEIRSLKKVASNFDLQDLIGLSVENAEWGLKLLGFGKRVVDLLKSLDSSRWTFRENFTIGIDDRHVTSITLFFPLDEPYAGSILQGLSSEPTFHDFIRVLGPPWKGQHPELMHFRTKQADITAGFDEDSGVLDLLNLHTHWPFPEFPQLD